MAVCAGAGDTDVPGRLQTLPPRETLTVGKAGGGVHWKSLWSPLTLLRLKLLWKIMPTYVTRATCPSMILGFHLCPPGPWHFRPAATQQGGNVPPLTTPTTDRGGVCITAPG